MHIAHITFRLFFSLLVFCIPEVYGHMLLPFSAYPYSNLTIMMTQLDGSPYSYDTDHDHYGYDVHTQDIEPEGKYAYGLRTTYEEAMQVYNPSASGGVDSEKSKASLHHLKDRMGKQQRWCALLVSGYVRLYVNEAIQAVDLPEVFIPKDMRCVIGTFLEVERDRPTIVSCVFSWALYDKQWAFITEWLAEGMGNPALYRDTDFLKKYATNIYTYDNNFLHTCLLQWLIHQQGWPVPTDAAVVNVGGIRGAYKMRCLQFLQHGNTFLYDLQCVHILNSAIMSYAESRKKALYTMRTKVIAKHPCLLMPLSYLSKVYWRQKYRCPRVVGNVVCDLVEIILWSLGSIVGAMAIKYSVGFGRLVTLLVAYLIFSIGPSIYFSIFFYPDLY